MAFGTNKKTLIILGIFFAAVLAAVFWYFFFSSSDKSGEEPALKVTGEIEKQIETAKDRLEELEKQSPEEKARIEKELETLSAQKVGGDVAVKGVEVSYLADKKILKNIAEGYSLELPLNLILARSVSSDLLEFHDKEFMCEGDPSCDPVIRIGAGADNPKRLPLEEWFEKREKEAGSQIYSPREKLEIRGETVYRVLENIPSTFEGYYYYWGKGEKIYSLRISSFDEENYGKYIQTFTLE